MAQGSVLPHNNPGKKAISEAIFLNTRYRNVAELATLFVVAVTTISKSIRHACKDNRTLRYLLPCCSCGRDIKGRWVKIWTPHLCKQPDVECEII